MTDRENVMTGSNPSRPRADGLAGLAQSVARWAEITPDAPACTFVDYGSDRAGSATTLTYAELYARARGVSIELGKTARPGDRAALLLPQGLDYVVAFLGCLYAGVLAVPLYAPDLRRSDSRIASAVADARPAVSFIHSSINREIDGVTYGRLISVDEAVPSRTEPDWEPLSGDKVAYLQYTSGSTRSPAGVMVTHDNMTAGAAQLRNAFDIGSDTPIVSWLPFFHDMGLLMGVIAPLHAGTHVVAMDPFAFVQRPVRWLRLITQYRAQISASPNFGLDQAVTRVSPSDRTDLDLGSLTALPNGAEPIRASTLDAFTEAYRPHGFKSAVHRPGYGLAETTLTVTATAFNEDGPRVGRFDRDALAAGKVLPTLGDGADDAIILVSCGLPEQQDISIVDPGTGKIVPPDTVGEIWVRGPNVCLGYFEKPEQTAKVFEQRLPEDPTEVDRRHLIETGDPSDGAACLPSRGWLRTGDLGFLYESQLYIAARLKDLIIINGHNHYPADIEQTVENALPLARTGHTVAFSLDVDGQERLIVVSEIEAKYTRRFDHRASRTKVRDALSRGHQVEAHEILFVRAGSIPKTTSGKLQRSACRRRFEEGSLRVLPVNESEESTHLSAGDESRSNR